MSKKTDSASTDHVSRIAAQWRRETPQIALDGMNIIGRARRLTLLSRVKIEAVFARHGLDTGEFDVLATLRRCGAPFALRPTELFQTLMISSGGLTDRLDRLDKRGLILRDASPSDRRSVLVRLSPKGRALIEKAFFEDMAVENELIGHLSVSEQKTLVQLLSKVLIGLEGGVAT